MAIVQRDLDVTERRHVLNGSVDNTITAATYAVALVPFPSQLVAAYASGIGLSGAPVLSLFVHRFIVGTGFTSIAVGSSVLVPAFGVSGGVTLSVSAAGTTYPLISGDAIVAYMGAANTALVRLNVSCVIQGLQDIRSAYGLSS